MNRRTSSILAAAFLIASSASAIACLEGELRQTIYLEPDGRVTVQVVALDLRSDSVEEEQELLDDVHSGNFQRELFPQGGAAVETTFLRSERPYTFVMTGTYRSVEEYFTAVFEQGDDDHEVDVRVEYLGDRTRLVLTVWTDDEATEPDLAPPAADDEGEADEQDDCSDPESSDDSLRFILVKGSFVEAEGFRIEGDTATLLSEECVAVELGSRTYSLTWTLE